MRCLQRSKFMSLARAVNQLSKANGPPECQACLLYTSDAADERSSVDLGGRRIIKKKKEHEEVSARHE